MNGRNNSENKASITAISVAMAYTRALSSKYSHLDIAAEKNLAIHLWNTGRQSLGWSNWALSGAISSAPYSSQESFFNSVVMPGYDSIILFRKMMIKQRIEAAIARGVKQIVILGGGYDVRALMTAAQYPDVQVYEVDQGATRVGKVNAIKSIPNDMGFDSVTVIESEDVCQVGDNLKFIHCDLTHDNLNDVLNQHGYDANQDSLIIAEGLTTYLNAKSNAALLRNATDLLTENSQLLISYLSSGTRAISKLEATALNESNEAYLFTIDPDNIIPFTLASGLAPHQKFDAINHLRTSGDAAATYHEANANAPREHYYLLSKDGMVITSINDVPKINFIAPTAARLNSSCLLL